MNTNELIELATMIATNAHKGQTRNDGCPYITHPLRVANNVEDRLKPIAILHDVCEDTPITLERLKDHGFPPYILKAIDLLTHKEGDSNIVYWNKILTNEDAAKVKVQDINDNLNDNPSDHAKLKYTRALALFKQYGYIQL